jgi:hypothetical protein
MGHALIIQYQLCILANHPIIPHFYGMMWKNSQFLLNDRIKIFYNDIICALNSTMLPRAFKNKNTCDFLGTKSMLTGTFNFNYFFFKAKHFLYSYKMFSKYNSVYSYKMLICILI